jgi:aspartyl-tRNA(Asn)/glutamyl-tRNA(Gln) amidotransferase subunit A
VPVVTPGVRAAFEVACGRLRDAGAIVEDVAPAGLEHTARALMQVLLPEASVSLGHLLEHADALAPQTRAQLELGYLLPAAAHVRAQRFRRFLGTELRRLFQDYDALIEPTVPFEAPYEDPPIDEASGFGELLCSAAANLCGLPSLTLPCGLGEGGLPVGLQLTAGPHADALLLGIGSAIEKLIWLQPPPAFARQATSV